MWQEIVVGLIVAVAVVLLGWRYWKTFSGRNDSRTVCSCGCPQCNSLEGADQECSDRAKDSAP